MLSELTEQRKGQTGMAYDAESVALFYSQILPSKIATESFVDLVEDDYLSKILNYSTKIEKHSQRSFRPACTHINRQAK